MARVIANALAISAIGFAVLAVGAAPACNSVGNARAAIVDDDSRNDFVTSRRTRAAQLADTAPAATTADRQSRRFAAFLAETDPPSFRRMLSAILDGRRFGDAVRSGYGADADVLWRRFMDQEQKD